MLTLNHLTGFGAGAEYVKVPEVASLCHFNGTDGATTTTDSIAGTVTLSGGGTVAYLTTGTKKFGTAGLRFDVDSVNWGRANWSSRASFIFPSDFTVEFQARQKTGYIYSSSGYLMSADGDDGLFLIDSDVTTGALNVIGSAWGGSGTIGLSLSTSSFRHFAIVRKDGTLTAYQDGVAQGSFSSSGTLNPSGLGFRIGGLNISNLWHGYFDEFRVYKDNAVYTSDFTPPSAEF